MIHAGVDIGGTNIKTAIVEEANDTAIILAKDSFPFTGYDYKVLCEKVDASLKKMLEDLELDSTDLKSIGMGVPGNIDPSGRILLLAHNIRYYDAPIADEINRYYPGLPVLMDNDANVAALAELFCGVFRGKKNALLLTIGTGLGGGLILNGKLFNGGRNHGVEVAHLPFNNDGIMCTCGNRGCMQAYTRAPWIAEKGKELLGDEYADAKAVIDLAKEGNETANKIIDEYIDNFASAIGGLCSFIDPEIIAIGGGVSASGDILFKPLKKLVKERNYFKAEYEIVPASMGNDAGVVGAAMLYANSLKQL